jgi:stage IV sporulation protein FB
LQQKSAPAVGIINASQRLIGLVTSATIGEMLMVHRAMPGGLRFRPWSRPAGA